MAPPVLHIFSQPAVFWYLLALTRSPSVFYVEATPIYNSNNTKNTIHVLWAITQLEYQLDCLLLVNRVPIAN